MTRLKLNVKRTPRYWLVGANWDGQDKTGKFTRNHYWEMGYHDEGKQELAKLRKSMKEGDRIAIKSIGSGLDNLIQNLPSQVKSIGSGLDNLIQNLPSQVKSIGSGLDNLIQNLPSQAFHFINQRRVFLPAFFHLPHRTGQRR
jgi:hypothetical protein